jgi:hypothetical protein
MHDIHLPKSGSNPFAFWLGCIIWTLRRRRQRIWRRVDRLLLPEGLSCPKAEWA